MKTSNPGAIATKTIKISFAGRCAASGGLAHLLKLVYASFILFPMSASALLMGEDGPEPLILQLKQSLRLSDDLNAKLKELAVMEKHSGVVVTRRWAGPKYLEMVSFPKDFTEDQALAVVAKLQNLPSIEKVVALSAFNLEFKSGDFARVYLSGDAIPEAALRGLDVDRLMRSAIAAVPDPDLAVRSPHVPNHIIVRWKDEFAWKADQTGARERINRFHAGAGCWIRQETHPKPHAVVQTLEFDSSVNTVANKMRQYKDLDWVDYVQPEYIGSTDSLPNDPYYTNPGQPNLTTISAPGAWSDQTGNQSLVVAVADSGANVSHPDFAPNLSPGSYNFFNDTSNVTDDYAGTWHGSIMASIIGAKGNNGKFMTGIDWNVSLLILKVIDSHGSGYPISISDAISYAYSDPSHQPAIAINLSLGFPHSSTLDPTLVAAAQDARSSSDMLLVAAAGNSGLNQEDPGNLVSPADIPTDNVLAVGATDGDSRWYASDYGRYRVELGAPGVNILGLQQSPTANPPYKFSTGTSPAAAQVTGAAALIKSKYPWENYLGLKDRIIMATDDVPALQGVFRTGGRLNLQKALHPRTVLRNLSTRAKVESGQRIMIAGFVIGGSGTGTLKIVIRGRGPSLAPLSVARLNNPTLTLKNSVGTTISSNDDWGNLPQTQKDDLAAYGLTPTDSREAAMVQTLPPGGYTVWLESQDGQFGVGLFELYEVEGGANEQTRLQNLSTRCPVGVGDEVAIAGIIIGNPSNPNDNTVPKRRVLLRGMGPTLGDLGVSGPLPDPQVELRDGSGALVGYNNQWRDVDDTSTGLESKLTIAGRAPQYDAESVLWPTLRQNFYTATLSGANGSTGVGSIEFYEY